MTTTNTFRYGQKTFLGGDMEASIKAFSKAIEDGDHPQLSHLNRGIAYLKLGQFAQAVRDFDRVLQEDNSHERALFYRGVAELNLWKNEEAVHDLDRCLQLNPQHGEAYLARGLAHGGLGHRSEMRRDLHDDRALSRVELGEFMEEYIIADLLFAQALVIFAKDNSKWRLSLTEDEVQRLAVHH